MGEFKKGTLNLENYPCAKPCMDQVPTRASCKQGGGSLVLKHFQVGSYRYRSLLEGLYIR